MGFALLNMENERLKKYKCLRLSLSLSFVTKFLALGDENKNYVFCFALRSLNRTFAMR